MTYVFQDGFTMNEIKTNDFGEIKAYMEDRAKTWELVSNISGITRMMALNSKYQMLALLDEIEDEIENGGTLQAGEYQVMFVNQLEVIDD